MIIRNKVLCVLVVLLLVLGTGHGAVRTVLMEGFTQWNCGPCANWNPQERAILNAFTRDTVVAIKYHGWWPGANNDVFYLWNETENRARFNFYGVTWVPWVMVDGVVDLRNVSASGLINGIRGRRAMPAPCTMRVIAMQTNSTTIQFTVTITTTDSALTAPNTRLFVALISNLVTYSSPPGANGETQFPDPFRDMWPSGTGQTISLPLDCTAVYTGTLNKDATWDASNLSVIAFIQNYTSRWVHQAAWAPANNPWACVTTTSDPRQQIAGVDVPTEYTIRLTNVGANLDSFEVSLQGVFPEGWSRSIQADGIGPHPDAIDVTLASGQHIDLRVILDPQGHGGDVHFRVNVQSYNSENSRAEEAFHLMAGLDVLLVDDDSGANGGVQQYFERSLNRVAGPRIFGRWDLLISRFDMNELPGIPVVIWFTGACPASGTLNAADTTAIKNYLDNGGKLFLTGQGIAFDMRSRAFLHQYLHVRHLGPNAGGRNLIGMTGDPISDALNLELAGAGGANNQTRQDAIEPLDLYASTLWTYTNNSLSGAVRVQTDLYKAVFFAFGFEAINDSSMRDTVMARVLDWLDPRSSSGETEHPPVPVAFALEQNYPNPFNPETVIPYSLPVRADVTLRVFDILGREAAVLFAGTQDAGFHTVRWNAAGLPSGVYFCHLKAGEFQATRKLLLLK